MRAAARASLALFAAILSIGTIPSAQPRINTPFQVISLWSDEMMSYLTGERQPACSGDKRADCTRVNPGICDGTVHVSFGSPGRFVQFPWGSPQMQTETRDPKGFRLSVVSSDEKTLELKFECAISDRTDDCPTGMFHIGLLREVDARTPEGELALDLGRHSRVLPEGKLVVSLDEAARKVLYSGRHSFYLVRAAAECFLVPPLPVEWIHPLYDGPSVTSARLGALVARFTPFNTMEWIVRTNSGSETVFEPDWVQSDWGYLYLMEQTVLDRRGDWVQLPLKPFSQAVWLQLSVRDRSAYDGHPGLHRLEPGPVYELTKDISARPTNGKGTAVFKNGDTIVVVAIHDRVLEFRKEEESDSPCAGNDAPAKRTLQSFRAPAEAFYDADLHLRLTRAYPKGC